VLKKRLRLEFHIDDPQAMFAGDPTRLTQMLVNLLSNAVKFTPNDGTVGLEVSVDRAARVVRFAVYDTGIGIAPADLERLFQPFSQLDSALNRAYEGTGLGLALVRRLAELHGGNMAVESTLGQGSRFTITLPYSPLPEEAAAEAHDLGLPPTPTDEPITATDPRRARILLVEDNEANIGPLRDYLDARGCAVVVARNGHEAIACVDEVQPDLILMDIHMPGMDGLAAIRLLRARPASAATPIIALTALAMPGDQERCLAAGATAYMSKPVRLRTLMETIQQLLDV
jgi:CheY-like chemotaxis protein